MRLEQLMRFFDPKLARKLDDTNEVSFVWSGSGMGETSLSQGFFSIYRSLFALLASDERLHTPPGETPLPYPGFGDSTTSYAAPTGMTRAQRDSQTWARDFYVVWGDFSTSKRFEWVARWDLERGEDRSMRRLMEKEASDEPKMTCPR